MMQRTEGGDMSYYQRHIFFCTNFREDGNCCEDHGATELRAYAKQRAKDMGIHGQGQVRVNTAGCLDRCNEGPVAVVYPEGVWYTYQDERDIDEILEEHLKDGRVVERLRI
jgi:(2Fe-2S) ferredoxin